MVRVYAAAVDVADSIAQQRALYGASLGECLQRITRTLGVSQATVARVTGISAPMLSQLASGHRIKIGNPQAAARFGSLLGLADEVEQGLPHVEVAARLEQVAQDDTATLTAPRAATPGRGDDAAVVSGVLRAVASGRELAEAAALLEEHHPDLARVLRVYGTGSPEEARRHHAGIAHLLG